MSSIETQQKSGQTTLLHMYDVHVASYAKFFTSV